MQQHTTNDTGKRGQPMIRSLLLAFVLILGGDSGKTAFAQALIIPEVRASFATQKFSGTQQLAAVFHTTAPTWTHAHHLEIAVGGISQSEGSSAFASFGPVWRWGESQSSTFLEFGFSPTLISGSTFGNRNMGGHLHFTSSLSIGRKLGRFQQSAIALRLQHISNGGLNDTNPGMDMIGLTFAFAFSS